MIIVYQDTLFESGALFLLTVLCDPSVFSPASKMTILTPSRLVF